MRLLVRPARYQSRLAIFSARGHAIGLGYLATQSGIKVRFVTAADLVVQLEKAQKRDQLEQFMRRSLLGPGIVIIDEVGYLPLQGNQANLFF